MLRYSDLLLFKMAAVRHIGLLKIGNFNRCYHSVCITVLNFMSFSQTVPKIWPFFDFSLLDFKKFEILLSGQFEGPICVSMPNFMPIGHAVAKTWPFFDFSRWRPSAILDLF